MCTASWLIREDGFELFFNRDESVRRGVARAPELVTLEGVPCLAPVDADAGGTWLGVNERGLALGLLNGWDARSPSSAMHSRGLLVRDLLGLRGGAEVAERMERRPLDPYRGFMLLVLEPGRAPEVHTWDGFERRRGPADLPLCSSSFDGERVREVRGRTFERLRCAHGVLDAELLAEFQCSHAPERGPWSPCMHRAEASTVSASRIQVGEAEISFRYAAGPPCTTAFGPALVLPRARA